jgi:hypothetical protein
MMAELRVGMKNYHFLKMKQKVGMMIVLRVGI